MSFRGKRKDGMDHASDETDGHAPPNKASKISAADDSDDSDDIVVCEVTLNILSLILPLYYIFDAFFSNVCDSRVLYLEGFFLNCILNKINEMWNSFPPFLTADIQE